MPAAAWLTHTCRRGAALLNRAWQVYSRLLAAFRDPSAPPGQPAPLHIVPFAGAGAGFALSLILGPTELLKCRLQTTSHKAGPSEILRHVIAEEGLMGLTRGLGATFIREVREHHCGS
jgi:solute carrier family 25 carnitine/acylcarnitine transporter 20/29